GMSVASRGADLCHRLARKRTAGCDCDGIPHGNAPRGDCESAGTAVRARLLGGFARARSRGKGMSLGVRLRVARKRTAGCDCDGIPHGNAPWGDCEPAATVVRARLLGGVARAR